MTRAKKNGGSIKLFHFKTCFFFFFTCFLLNHITSNISVRSMWKHVCISQCIYELHPVWEMDGGAGAWMGGSKNGIRMILRLSFSCNNNSLRPLPPTDSHISLNAVQNYFKKRRKLAKKKKKKMRKKNDQSLRCELAETKLASSLLYLLVVPKYIYIYRRKKNRYNPLLSLSLGHEYRSSITVVQQKKNERRK